MSSFASKDYQKSVEEHPFHNHFERPATVALLPDLKGLKVLDAGCGTGWYSAYMLNHGAEVTALDITPEMLELTRQRVNGKITAILASLEEVLPFEAESFDLVLSTMTLHYLKDWTAVFKELNRSLKPGGRFIFSTHHPFTEFQASGETYFALEERVRKTLAGHSLRSYRRPLGVVLKALRESGLGLEHLEEPVPLPSYAQFDADDYQKACKAPQLLLISAKKL